jgi:hypothetical protein
MNGERKRERERDDKICLMSEQHNSAEIQTPRPKPL